MKPRVYLETTIPSYLTTWLSRDLVMAGHQQTTREWWDTRREDFELFVSQFVIDEAGPAIGMPRSAAWNCWRMCHCSTPASMFSTLPMS
jgi:hypothetical protein